MKKYRKQFVALGICLAICLAIVVSWTVNRNADDVLDAKTASTESGNDEDKVLGQADFVSAATEYFDSARLNRKETRDEAIGVLKGIIESESASAEEKADANAKLISISDATDAEGRIENLVKAKGYTECLAIIGDESVNVIVQTQGLESGDVATIKDIASEQSDKSNIKIIESK